MKGGLGMSDTTLPKLTYIDYSKYYITCFRNVISLCLSLERLTYFSLFPLKTVWMKLWNTCNAIMPTLHIYNIPVPFYIFAKAVTNSLFEYSLSMIAVSAK